MDEIDATEWLTRHDECPRCGGSTERNPIEDYGDLKRRHLGPIVRCQDGDDGDCDWAIDVPDWVLKVEKDWEDDHYEREAAYLKELD